MNGVFQEHLINGKVAFLDKIKKKNLKTRIKSAKKSKSKTFSTLQEDCQAFGHIIKP